MYEAEKRTDKKEYIPEVGGEILPEDSLYCPNPGMSAEYLVFQSIDLSQSGKTIDSMAVLGAEGTYYMSEKISMLRPRQMLGGKQKSAGIRMKKER